MISPEVLIFLPRSPGAAWQPLASAGTGHMVKTNYGTNTATGLDAIRLWTVVMLLMRGLSGFLLDPSFIQLKLVLYILLIE
ncbi:hypothetical protein [Sphingobacterium faecium]